MFQNWVNGISEIAVSNAIQELKLDKKRNAKEIKETWQGFNIEIGKYETYLTDGRYTDFYN